VEKHKFSLFNALPWYTDAISTLLQLKELSGFEVRIAIHLVLCSLILCLQGILNLILQTESMLFTGVRGNAFYEALLSSEESVSKCVQRHKPENADKLQATQSLLLYRLADVIVFVHGQHHIDQSHVAVKRCQFPLLKIPVCCFIQFSTFSDQF
jgi:hypothetical protein